MKALPRLLLVTGMSGAGKSTVLDALEDMGWDCVDNLPTALLKDFVHGEREARQPMPVAVGMDMRSRGFDPRALPDLLRSIEGVTPEILYLDCAGSELIRRYDETRRRHPMAPDRPAEDGVAKERAATAPLRQLADTLIDTTDLDALRAAIRPGMTKLVYVETPANPVWSVTDIAGAAAIANPPSPENTRNTVSQNRNMRRLPSRSAARPPSSVKPP